MGTAIGLTLLGFMFYGIFVATGVVQTNPSGGSENSDPRAAASDALAGYRPSTPSVGRTPSVTYS